MKRLACFTCGGAFVLILLFFLLLTRQPSNTNLASKSVSASTANTTETSGEVPETDGRIPDKESIESGFQIPSKYEHLIEEGWLDHVSTDKYPWQWVIQADDQEQRMVADHLMVSLQDHADLQAINTVLAEHGYSIRDQWNTYLLISWELRAANPESPIKHIKALQAILPGMHVGPDLQFRSMALPINEKLYPSDIQDDRMGVQWLYENGYRADGITVAVLDTGIHADHPDLEGRIVPGYDFVDNDFDTADLNNHGSYMSAIITANPDNQTGMAGLAPGSSILPIRILNEDGKGWTSDGIKGIDYARSKGATIINASWGGMWLWSKEMEDSIKAYIGSDGIFVCAAGNDSKDLNTWPNFPASYNFAGMIVVGGLKNDFSYREGNSNYGDEVVDIMAPWKWNVPCIGCDDESFVAKRSGTSVSTAIVSAFVAVAKANFNEPKAIDLINRVSETGILAPGAATAAEHPGFPNFERMFANFRPGIPVVTGHSIDTDPILDKVPFTLNLEVQSDGEYAITDLSGDHVYPSNGMSLMVSHAEGGLFTFRVYSINGYSWYGPFRLHSKMELPGLQNPPDPFMAMPLENDLDQFEFTVAGSYPFTVRWETDTGESGKVDLYHPETNFTIPTYGLPAGRVSLTVSNDFGKKEYEFQPTWDNKFRATMIPPIWDMLPYGDYMLGREIGLDIRTFLYDGHKLVDYPYDFSWDYGSTHIGYYGNYPVFKLGSSEIVTFDNDGHPVVTPVDLPGYGNETFRGVFNGHYIFSGSNKLRVIDTITGNASQIDYPFYWPESLLQFYISRDALVLAGSEDNGAWRLEKDLQWTEVPELMPYIHGSYLGLYATEDFLFYFTNTSPGLPAEIHYSSNAIEWQSMPVEIPPDARIGSSFSRPFVYDNGIGFFCKPPHVQGQPETFSYYRYELGNPTPIPIIRGVPEEYIGQWDPPVSIGTMLKHGRYIHYKGQDYHYIDPRAAMYYVTARGFYIGSASGTYYSTNLTVWHKVTDERCGVLDLNGEIVLVSPTGIYSLQGPWITGQIGPSFPADGNDSGFYLEEVGGYLFARRASESDWYCFDLTTGTWDPDPIDGATAIQGHLYYTRGNQVFRHLREGPDRVFQPSDMGVSGAEFPNAYITDSHGKLFVILEHPSLTGADLRFFESTDGTAWTQVNRPGLQGYQIDYPIGESLYSYSSENGNCWYRLDPDGDWIAKGDINENCLNIGSYFGQSPVNASGQFQYVLLQDQETLSNAIYNLLPKSSFSGSSGWFVDPQLGWFSYDPTYPSYIWSMDHGWLFVAGSTDAGYLYDATLGWLFYHRGQYPNLYRYADGDWLLYLEGSRSPRWFWSNNAQQWISHSP